MTDFSQEKEKYILIRDLAPRTPYTQGYLSLLARRGKVDAIKVGKAWHINPKSLEAYMATTDSPASVEAEKSTFVSREPHAELASLSSSAQAALYPPQFVPLHTKPVEPPVEIPVQPTVKAERITQPEQNVDSLADALDRHFKSRGRLSRFNYFAKKTVVIPWAATAVLVATLTALFLFVDGFSFGKVDAMALRIKQAVEDAQTLQGYMPGTHANEVLLLDDEGKISIYGHIETRGQIRSLASDGVAPLVVDSTVTVENLSADYVDGFSHEEFTLAFVTERGNVTTERVFLNGGASVGGTLSVSGATKLMSYLEVYGELHALSNAIVDGTLTVNDDVTLKDDLAVGGSIDVEKHVRALSGYFERAISTDGHIHGESLGISGDASVGDLDASSITTNSLTVDGDATFNGISLAGTGTSTFGGNLSVAGDGYFGGDVDIIGNLEVGSISLGTLGVTGTSTARRYLASDLGGATSAAFSFSGDEDTGIYSAAADTLNFTTGGVTRLTLDSAGNAAFTGTGTSTMAGNVEVSGDGYFGGNVQIDGDLAVGNLSLSELTVTGTSTSHRFLASDLGGETAAAYSFSGDTNTGIYSQGPDILNFTTAGVTRVTIDASGNVAFSGTGTSTVAGNLDLAGEFNATRYDITGTGTSTNAGNLSVAGDGYFGGNVQIIGNLDVGALNLSDITATGTSTARRYLASDLGGATSAAYGFSSDVDTGIYSSGADTLNFATAGTNRLTLDSSGNAAFSGTGTSTMAGNIDLVGDIDAANFYTTGTGTSTMAGNLDLAGDINATRFDITGSAGTSTIAGHLSITGNVSATGGLFVIGDSIADTVYINSYIQSNLVPFPNATYDLGTAARYWNTLYVDTINANTIAAASTSISGTINEDFTINSDNATADLEDMSLIFYRGTIVPNAVITWDSSEDHFDINHPVHIQNDSSLSLATNATLIVQGQVNQTADIFQVASTTGDILLNVTHNNRVGVSTTTPGATFAVDGGVLITGNTNIGGTLDVAGDVTFNGSSVFSDLRAATLNASSTTVGTLTGYGLAVLPDLRASTLNASSTTLGTATLYGALTNTTGLSTLSDLRAANLNSTTTNIGTLTTYGSANIGSTLTATGGLSTLSDLRVATLNASSTTVGTLAGYGLAILPDLRASTLNASTTLLTSATTTNLAITGITGSNQCLQVDTNGTVTGAGTVCASGAAWHQLFTNAITPTSTTAGIFVNASSTFDSTLRVNGNTELNGILSVTNTATSSIAGGLTVDTTTLVVNDNENRVGIGTASPEGKLTVQSGNLTLLMGADVNAETLTNSTRKFVRFGMPHYTTSEEAVMMFTGDSNSTLTSFNFGGGSSLYNAATELRFYTAANTTTLNGVERMTVDSNGDVGIGDTDPDLDLEVVGTFGVSATANGDGDIFIVDSNGDFGIATTTPGGTYGEKLTVVGGAYITGLSVLPDLRVASLNATSATIDSLTVNTSLTNTGTSTARRFLASDLGGEGSPAFSFSSDTNTGIYSGGANQLNLVVGGANGLTLDSNRDVTLAQELFINGAATSTIAGGLTVDTNTLVVDDENGRVGIGTVSPTSLLHLVTNGAHNSLHVEANTSGASSLRLNSANNTSSFIQFEDNESCAFSLKSTPSTGEFALIDGCDGGTQFLRIEDGIAADSFFFRDTGALGIATTTPGGTYGEKLTVVGGAYITGLSVLPDLRSASLNATSATIDSLTVNTSLTNTGTSTARRFLASDLGNATAAAFSFSGDLNTGIFSAGADQLNLTTGGTLGLTLDSSQDVTLANELFVSGTGTSTIAGGLTVDTTTLVVNDNENRVGIGTANPVTTLEVRGDGATARIFRISESSTNYIDVSISDAGDLDDDFLLQVVSSGNSGNFVFTEGGRLNINTANAPEASLEVEIDAGVDPFYVSSVNDALGDLFNIQADGTVGIATTTPGGTYGEELTVVGAGYFTDDVYTGGELFVSGTGTSTIAGGLTVDTTTLVVNANDDRVGIGTASPNASLEITRAQGSGTLPALRVGGSDSNDLVAFFGSGHSSGNNAYVQIGDGQQNIASGLRLGGSDTNTLYFEAGNTDYFTIEKEADESRLSFNAYNGSSLVERLSIDRLREAVGISTTTPGGTYGEELTVSGAAFITGGATTTSLAIAGITGSTQCLQADTNGTVTGTGIACGSGASEWVDAGAYVYPDDADYAAFPYFTATSTTATSTIAHSLTVDTSTLVVNANEGRVGIGTESPLYQFEVQGDVDDFIARIYNSSAGSPNDNGLLVRAGAASGDTAFEVRNLGDSSALKVDGDRDVTLGQELFVSGTATSTFAGGLTVDTDTLVVNDNEGRVYVGTTTPAITGKFGIWAATESENALYIQSSDNGDGSALIMVQRSQGNQGIVLDLSLGTLGRNPTLELGDSQSADDTYLFIDGGGGNDGVFGFRVANESPRWYIQRDGSSGAIGAADDLIFRRTTDGSTFHNVMTLANANTFVGIGTTTPDTTLAVVSVANTHTPLSVAGFSNDQSANLFEVGKYASSTPYLTLSSDGALALASSATSTIAHSLVIDTDTLFVNANEGEVGINNTNPDAYLEITGVSQENLLRLSISSTNYVNFEKSDQGDLDDDFVMSVVGSSGTGSFVFSDFGRLGINSANLPDAKLEIVSGGGDVLFLSSAADALGDIFNVQSTGEVGIATTTPGGTYGEKLTVVGGAYVTGLSVLPDLRSSVLNATSTNLGTLNVYGASTLVNASTTNLAITGITGSTQCLQADTNGTVTGTGSACGSGGGEWLDAGAYVYPDDADYAAFPYFTATSTTATSTIAHSLAIDTDTFVVNANENRVGVGTVSPTVKLEVGAGGTVNGLRVGSSSLGRYIEFGYDSIVNIFSPSGAGSAAFIGATLPSGRVIVTENFGIDAQVSSQQVFIVEGASGQSADYIQVRPNAGTEGTLLTMDANGDFGIATTTPGGTFGEKLTVVGGSYVSGDSNVGGALFVRSASATSTIAHSLTVDTSTLVVNANEDEVGIGTVNPNNAALHILKTISASGTFNRGLYVQPTFNQGSSGNYFHYGTAIFAETSGAGDSTGEFHGIAATASQAGSGSLDHISGGRFLAVKNAGPGTITDAHGIDAVISLAASGNITTAYGGKFSVSDTGSGSILTGYGIYIEDVGATTDYGIYQNGSDDINYFAGNVGLSTTTPGGTYGEKLTVVGGAYITGLSVLPDLRASVLNASSTNLGTLNVYGASTLVNASTTNLAITGITGSTQCLQADTNGTVTGTGSGCGGGSSKWTDLGTQIYPNDGDSVAFPFLAATSTTATSTIAHSLTVDTSTLYVNANENRVGIGTTTPKYPLAVGGNTLLMGHVGIGNQAEIDDSHLLWAAFNARTVLTVQETITDLTSDDWVAGISNHLDLNPSTNAASDVVYVQDTEAWVRSGNTRNIGTVYMTYSEFTHAGSGTITNAYGLLADVDITGGGTITNAYGVAVLDINGSNTFGLYQSGADDKNYFAGNTGIGDLNPTAMLQVAGQISGHYFTATSTTATSTMVHSFTVDTSTLFVNASENRVGVGTTTPQYTFVADGTVELGRGGLGHIQFVTTTQGGTPTLIGIGTTTPDADLTLVSDQTASNTYVFTVGTTTAGAVNLRFTVDSDGDIKYDGSATSPADYAEAFAVEGEKEEYEPGDIMVLSLDEPGKVRKSSAPYEDGLVGVYSTKPGIIGTLASDITNYDISTSNDIPVGVMGRVPVKVTTENGPIAVGDRITSSSLLGVGMRSDGSGMIVGRALETYKGSGVGKIMVMVDPMWYSGNLAQLMEGQNNSSSTPVVSQENSTSTTEEIPTVIDVVSETMVNLWDVTRDTIASVAGSLWNVTNSVVASTSKLRIFGEDEDSVTYETYNLQSGRKEITISGTAEIVELQNVSQTGARVAFDESFVSVIDEGAPIKVIITPTSRLAGSLYVHEKSRFGFEVREENGESIGATFDWLVIARARGDYNPAEDPEIEASTVEEDIDPAPGDTTPTETSTTTPESEPTATSTPTETTTESQPETDPAQEPAPEISSEPLITPPAPEPETETTVEPVPEPAPEPTSAPEPETQV